MAVNQQELISSLMQDVVGDIELPAHDVNDTIRNILNEYNLNTDLSFVEKIATMKFDNKADNMDIDYLPRELQDAAFLPVNTIADIALRQDLDMIISQIPELYKIIQVLRDATCEADNVTGRLAREIIFDKTIMDDSETENLMSKIDAVEERLELDSTIKNHIVYNGWLYGESYMYVIPYAKVFADLNKYKLSNNTDKGSLNNMFSTSSTLSGGYGFAESFEISLSDTIVNETNTIKGTDIKKTGVFTEQEIIDLYPAYHNKSIPSEMVAEQKQHDAEFDKSLDCISKNIHYVDSDVALPVIEESAHDLETLYMTKYKDNSDFIQESQNIFEQVMESNPDNVSAQFERIKGVYMKPLPATKLIPIRIDKTVIGYYYISDLTRPEQAGERKNSGLGGYTLRTPSIGYDTFTPDQMFCEKLSSKIINNFNLKFMRDNVSLHKQIVSILMSHRFNEAMLRFVYIPAEHVVQFTLNKDGMGKGHSVLEPGLVTARMYMFLKLYSILYQINNSQIRVYNLRMSGIDKNYKQLVQEQMRKFAARRITANDIFNYRSSMTKVSGGSELIMPLGTNDKAPVTVDSIPAAEAPINNELLETLKDETINSTPVSSMLIKTSSSEVEFAKEMENANTIMNSAVASAKIELNPDITRFYRIILRWETDIAPDIISDLKYSLRIPTAKQLNVTSEMLGNFNAINDVMTKTFLTTEERKGGEDGNQSEVAREYTKLLIAEFMPQIDIERFAELADEARNRANKLKLAKTNSEENIVDDLPEEGMI